jgi:hypothetical protein
MTDHKHAMPAAPKTIINDTFWAAKGDLAGGTANDTAAVLSVGADDTILMADAAAATGMKWVAAGSPSAVSTSAATGTADTFTRGDHVHAHETAHIAHDTVWDAAGDLVVGTGADTAAKLGITVPAANILEVLGVVNGETTATWKAVHDGTAPVTQAIADAAAAGTALTAAHRDHKHGMPAVGYPLSGTATIIGALTSSQSFATATTSISAATYADVTGPSVVCAAGTWLLLATIVASVITTTAGIVVAAITDSANAVICEAAQSMGIGTASVAQNGTIHLAAVVTIGSQTTYKLRAARGTTTYTSTVVIMDGASLNTANNTTDNSDKGTVLIAIRLA